MKITFVKPFTSAGGGTRVVATYAKHLIDLGHDVVVVSHPERPLNWRQKLRHLQKGKLWPKPRRSASELMEALGARHVVVEKARPITAADVPDSDVVIATWWETAEWVANFPDEKGRKFYLLQDYEVFPNLPRDRVIATLKGPFKKLAVSSYIANVIQKNHGVEGIELLPNAVDATQFKTPPRPKNKSLNVGFLYNRSPRKNAALAVAAMEAAKKKIPDLRFHVLCAQDLSADLPNWAEMHINPAQSDLADVYAACDIWLLSSDHEGFGLPILEAMACRTPVVSTRAGAAMDLITPANGAVIDSTVEAFVAQIERFSAMSPQDWAVLSEGAYQSGLAHNWEDATDRLVGYLSQTD